MTSKTVNYLPKVSFCAFWKQVFLDRLQHVSSLAVAVHVYRKTFLYLFLKLGHQHKDWPLYLHFAKDNFLKRKFLIGLPIREILPSGKLIFVQLDRNFSFYESKRTIRVQLITTIVLLVFIKR